MNALPGDYRSLPGIFTSNAALVNQRVYALAFPVPSHLTLTSVLVDVKTGGEAGSVLRVGVFTDEFGWPADLIEDFGTVAADTTGVKTFTASSAINGGRFVWVSVAAQAASTTPPQTARISYSPFKPVVNDIGGDDATYFAPVATGVSGAFPSVWPTERSGASANLSNVAPYISVGFGARSTSDILGIPDRFPVLLADQAWEEDVLEEPCVYTDGTTWYMLYTGGWSSHVIGYATAPSVDGPWTKQGRILGGGYGGEAGSCSRSSILYENGTLYVYFNNGGTSVRVCSGSSPASLGSSSQAMSAAQGTVTSIQNTSVINDGGTYRMLFESKVSGAGVWKTGYATASSPTGAFTLDTFPLSTMQINTGMFGGPWLTKVGSEYRCWYHASPNNNAQLPTQVYRATSSDMTTWTPSQIPKIRRRHPYEVDQVADVFLVDSGGVTYAFWSALDNNIPTGAIMRNVPQAMSVTS